MARRSTGPLCQAVNDPWENMCQIHKKAEIACSDLNAPGAKRASTRAGRKAVAMRAAQAGNPRKDCVDAYMRNV